jgi:hypothetical protein
MGLSDWIGIFAIITFVGFAGMFYEVATRVFDDWDRTLVTNLEASEAKPHAPHLALAALDGVKMDYVRTTLLFVISLSMVAVGLSVLAFGLFWHGPRVGLFVAGGAMAAIVGLYLLWADFVAPLFARRWLSCEPLLRSTG